MKILRRTVKRQPMQRVAMYRDIGGGLEANIYEIYVIVTKVWWLWKIPVWIWVYETEVEERPIHELIKKAFGG